METLEHKAKLAAELDAAFESFTRPNDPDHMLYRIKESERERWQELMRECHGDMLPDDHRYGMIREIVSALTESPVDDWDDLQHEICERCVDIYHDAQAAWLASNSNRAAYCDDAVSSGLIAAESNLMDRIGAGQYVEACEIFSALVNGLQRIAVEA